MRGFPIRRSSDHGSFANSPRLIAGYYVLLRLLVPRHPPCALKNLTTKIIQRCSRPLCSSQATTGNHRHPAPAPAAPTPSTRRKTDPTQAVRPDQMAPTKATPPRGCSLRTQQRAKPTRDEPVDSVPSPQQAAGVLEANRPNEPASSRRSTLEHHPDRVRTGHGPGHQPAPHDRDERCQMLLRKEVIQPHLPVRLPCYDLVLIASPTFDDSPLAVGPSASGVTDFHDLTGGVYKARERIHRSVADLRLLATPTSWGRVADPNPN